MRSRTSTDIAAHILETAKPGKGRLEIMHEVFIPYNELCYYLSILCQNGLLQASYFEYKTTPKGLKFLKGYNADPDSVAIEINDPPFC